MERALVLGASGGIGFAVAAALERENVQVVRISRSQNGLDITNEGAIVSCFAKLQGPFNLIFVATGALDIDRHGPEKSIDAITAWSLRRQFEINAVGPALLIKHVRRYLPVKSRSVIAVLSARVGSIGDNKIGGWYGYRSAKAALNQLVHSAAIELGRTHKHNICIAVHPGTVATPLMSKYVARNVATEPSIAAGRILDVIRSRRPSDTGRFFDYSGSPLPW